ncbi:MAG: hypothetical protein U0U46_01095 [Saprospiraceae bacterium]|nr:hypothetical protein [Saprospiraceae bacterium]HNL38002.1 hypothetical protein [Saprospiraceae bacterium]
MAKRKYSDDDIKKALQDVDDQLVGMVDEFVNRRKKAYVKAAQELRSRMEKQAIEFSELLAEGKITVDLFQMLIKQSAAEAKIHILEQSVVSRAKFDELVEKVAIKVAKTLIPIVLGAL